MVSRWAYQNVWFSIGNTTIWNIHKINASITVAKFEYNLGNMKDCENQLTKQKRDTPKRLIIIVVFEEKWTMMLEDKKGHSKNAYNYCRFWTILMITRLEERRRTKQFWVWQGLQQEFEAPATRDQNDALSNFEPGGDYSKILRSKRGRKNREFERHRSLADRYRSRHREAKPRYPDGLPRLRARTPCCKQLFGE